MKDGCPATYPEAMDMVQRYEAVEYMMKLWLDKEVPDRQEEPMEIGAMAGRDASPPSSKTPEVRHCSQLSKPRSQRWQK